MKIGKFVFFSTMTLALGILDTGSPARAEAGDWLVRLRGILVAPDDSSGPVLPGFPGGGAKVNNAVTPEVDVTYMFTRNIGAELIAATSKHTATGTGDRAGLPLLNSGVLPPTLTIQWHFAPEAKLSPYVGAGINYTVFYNNDAKSALNAALGPTKVHLSDSFGWAAQVGIDYALTDSMFLNLDVKYIDMDTTVRLNTGGAINRVKVAINPIVFGIGIGKRF